MVFASARSNGRAGNQRLLAAAGGLFCVALIVVAVLLHPSDPKEETPRSPDGTLKVQNKSQSPWNLALGNVVAVAPDLGLAVKGQKDLKIDSSRLAAILDGQLGSLREIYRAESEKHPALMGALLLEIVVGDGGQVAQTKELKSRVANPEFRKLVLAEVKNWNFKDAVPDGSTIHCPLLFVREGMEIATLTKWEKSLGLFAEKPHPAPVSVPPKPQVEPTQAQAAEPAKGQAEPSDK